MAKVVELKAGENPPEGIEKWVLVTRDEAPRAEGVNVTQHSDGATFAVSSDGDGEEAIRKAAEWADENGIATVYVRAS